MFALTRPNRQILFTLAVLALTVAPTGYVGLTAWKVNQPEHRRQVEIDLGQQLGVQVTLRDVRYPRPGMVVYDGAVLKQLESGRGDARLAEIARAEKLVLHREGRTLRLDADGLRLRGQGPKQAMAQVGALLQRAGGGSPFDRISLIARTCEIDLGPTGPRYTLHDLAGMLQADPQAPVVTASYKVVGASGTSPRCELTLTRDRHAEVVGTRLTLKTMDGAVLPARVLDAFFNSEDWLGGDAQVQGELALQQAGSADWDATFRGSLIDVDLDRLIGRLAPEHRLSGHAQVVVESARWADQPGRGFGWVAAKGELRSGRGTIGTPLLQALQSQLHFRIDDRADWRNPEQEFQALGLAFTIHRNGEIQLAGALGDLYRPGAVMLHGQRDLPLAFAPDGIATVPGLTRALGSSAIGSPDQVVPATFESQLIQRFLPGPVHRAN